MKKPRMRFGAIAIKKEFVTLEQLLEAINIQVMADLEGKGHRLIGEILVSQGNMTDEQVDEVFLEIIKDEHWLEKETPGTEASIPEDGPGALRSEEEK